MRPMTDCIKELSKADKIAIIDKLIVFYENELSSANQFKNSGVVCGMCSVLSYHLSSLLGIHIRLSQIKDFIPEFKKPNGIVCDIWGFWMPTFYDVGNHKALTFRLKYLKSLKKRVC